MIALLTACAGPKIAHSKISAHNDLKKRILVLPTLNHTALDESKARQIRSQFLEALQKDSQIIIQEDPTLPSTDSLPPKIILPELGIWSDAVMLKKAEADGGDILLLPILNPFEVHEKRSGIWPIFKSKEELEVSMTINVFDLVRHTVYLINVESQKIKIPNSDLQGLVLGDQVSNEQKWKYIPEAAWQKTWSHIIARQASAFFKDLRKQPWTGQIVATEAENILINAGQDAGVREGQIFEVFEKSEPLPGANGQIFFQAGPKLAEIQVTKVQEKTALAKPLNPLEVKTGQWIRVKP
jgi:hypothetical protein